ncbi:MAG: PAT family beta-lactamase induction signal transducer AmpG [Parasphingorhabdus sp.]|jgi:PAT family beta-lactamase induction signal transducer AmpG
MSEQQTVRGWKESLTIYTNKKVVAMLFLGFSAGLPLYLVFGTLSFWMREAEIQRSTIGFISWIGLTYAFKWMWSPLVDRMPLPWLTKLMGRRRSWLLASQICVAASLCGMGLTDPSQDLGLMVTFAILTAFASATQDIALDAYRIESADVDWQAALAASYLAGYRIALIASQAGALVIAGIFDSDESTYEHYPWMISYLSMGALMLVGMITTMLISESESRVPNLSSITTPAGRFGWLPGRLQLGIGWFYAAAVIPFIDFFQRYKWHALLILSLISMYRISDIVLGVMANVFYSDMQYTKLEIAQISKVYGPIMTIVGAGVGGVMMMRYGVMVILFLGAALTAVTNTLFALLATIGHDLTWLTVVISADNLSAGIATAAFIAYLSSLTSISYTATQYALFSSMMLLFPKLIAGFSGVYVETYGYVIFFLSAAALGLPALVIIFLAAKYIPAGGFEPRIVKNE